MKITTSDMKNAIAEITAVCRVVSVGEKDIIHALKIYEDYKYSYFDSLMIASAIRSGCQYLLSWASLRLLMYPCRKKTPPYHELPPKSWTVN